MFFLQGGVGIVGATEPVAWAQPKEAPWGVRGGAPRLPEYWFTPPVTLELRAVTHPRSRLDGWGDLSVRGRRLWTECECGTSEQ